MHCANRHALRAAVLLAAIAFSAGGLAPVTGAAEATRAWTTGLDVTLEGATSLSGGTRSAQTFHGLALATVRWEPVKTAGRTLSFRGYGSALALAGRGPTAHFLGDFLAASNIEGFDSARLYSWWLEAQRDDWSLRAGALLADEEFTGTEGGGNFFNSAFGWPAFISANTVNTGPAFFVAAPGVRLEYRYSDSATWRFGVYDGDTFDSAAGDPTINRHGLHYQVGGTQGWFVISEVNFTPVDQPTRGRAGVWLHTAKFDDVRDDTTGARLATTGSQPLRHAHNYGAYANVERTLAGKPGAAGYVTAFARLGLAPADRNTLTWALDTGIAVTGLLPGRAADITAFGLAHANFSSRLADHARALDPTSPSPDYEQVIELNHSAVLSEHFTLQPDLQYIRHPGGSGAQRDALAFFLRLKAGF